VGVLTIIIPWQLFCQNRQNCFVVRSLAYNAYNFDVWSHKKGVVEGWGVSRRLLLERRGKESFAVSMCSLGYRISGYLSQ
jgi:hypothetical protein